MGKAQHNHTDCMKQSLTTAIYFNLTSVQSSTFDPSPADSDAHLASYLLWAWLRTNPRPVLTQRSLSAISVPGPHGAIVPSDRVGNQVSSLSGSTIQARLVLSTTRIASLLTATPEAASFLGRQQRYTAIQRMSLISAGLIVARLVV